MRTSVGWSERVDPVEGALESVELCRALCDPFHDWVAGQHVSVALKLLRRGQTTVWIFCRIRMISDPFGGARIRQVIKVGVLLCEEDSVFVISHSFVPADFVQIELDRCNWAGVVAWNQ